MSFCVAERLAAVSCHIMELHQSGKAVPQMTESERLLRSILGPTRSDIRPLAFAIAVAEELLFNQGLAMDDVQITKQIYPMVARQFRKTDNAAAKCVERLSRLCWEAMVAQDLVAQYLGRAIQQSPTLRSPLRPYKGPDNKNFWIIDEETAEIVRFFVCLSAASGTLPIAASTTREKPRNPNAIPRTSWTRICSYRPSQKC